MNNFVKAMVTNSLSIFCEFGNGEQFLLTTTFYLGESNEESKRSIFPLNKNSKVPVDSIESY